MNLAVRWVAALGVAVMMAGCPKQENDRPPVATSRPARLPPPAAASQPGPASQTTQPAAAASRPSNRVEIRIRTLADPQDGWLGIEAIRQGAPGAWATGALVLDHKIVIDTEDVEQFSIDLSQLHVNWNRRVILRIDGHASELTKKRRPVLHLRRSPAGSWDVVER